VQIPIGHASSHSQHRVVGQVFMGPRCDFGDLFLKVIWTHWFIVFSIVLDDVIIVVNIGVVACDTGGVTCSAVIFDVHVVVAVVTRRGVMVPVSVGF
jgi:hypothetical protein